MRLTRGLTHSRPFKKGCILSIGNFDGVHLGHQLVIKKLTEQSKRMALPVVLMLFEPQPLEFFYAQNAPVRLMCLREKIIQLKSLSIDNICMIKFNQNIANYSADDFIRDFLVKKLNVKHLIVGDDFHFGKARCGDFTLLQKKGLQHGFMVENTPACFSKGVRVSSTLIRNALGIGDLGTVKQMLGRDYAVCGKVIHGNKQGRTIGFPTANIQMFKKDTPLIGVYAVTMTGIDNKEINGIANIGVRPTVGGVQKMMLEIHLFNFNQEIYGQYVAVHFKQKIRDEVRFDSMSQLKAQIERDIIICKSYL